MQETQVLTDGADRFIKNDNALVAFEFWVICVLLLFIWWREKAIMTDRKEANQTNKDLAVSLALLTKAIDSHGK